MSPATCCPPAKARMDEQERNAMAYILLKFVIKKNFNLGGISDAKREIGNIAKATNLDAEKLLRFADIIIREVFEEQMEKLRRDKVETKVS